MSAEILRQLEREGWFKKVAEGDHRACGLFTRLAAYRLNPTGSTDGWGALRKTGGGRNVEGYSEDAIVLGNDPMNRRNVVDIIGSAGAPGARLNTNLGSFVSRRAEDIWEKPVPLTQEQQEYLMGQTVPTPTPQPTPIPQPLPSTECKFQPCQPCQSQPCQFQAFDAAPLQAQVADLRAKLQELSDRLSNGLEGEASARWIGTLKFKVKG